MAEWRNDRRPKDRPILTEVVTSLPGGYRKTRHLPPEDLTPEEFVEISTGEDDPRDLAAVGHRALGLLFVGVDYLDRLHLGLPRPTGHRPLGLPSLFFVVTYVVTILGVPWMRRRARNRNRA